MADRIAHPSRNLQAYSPLPQDVIPNIMLGVESRQAFTRLARTCHSFYAWSEPWLKSRKQAAELTRAPQWQAKLPAWIKTHSHHLHPADWKSLLRCPLGTVYLPNFSSAKFDIIKNNAKPMEPGVVSLSKIDNTVYLPYLDFILFSPRLVPDIDPDLAQDASARLAGSLSPALVGFEPKGEAWQCDVLAGATAWLKQNTATMDITARSMLLATLSWAMTSVMVAQRSPALAVQLLEHGLVKSHYIKTHCECWEDPLLSALIEATISCKPKPGSDKAIAFISALHRTVSTLAQLNESLALVILVDKLKYIMKIMVEKTWTPGSAGTALLQTLVQAVRDMPEALANTKKTLLDRHFITEVEWEKVLVATQGTLG